MGPAVGRPGRQEAAAPAAAIMCSVHGGSGGSSGGEFAPLMIVGLVEER